MITTLTFVKQHADLADSQSKEQFMQRWAQHTQDFDLVDHPYISKNRLMLIEGHPDYIGMAENHWPDLDSLIATDEFYKTTERGKAHWADLCEFMDIDNSPTVIVSKEVDVSDAGIVTLFPPTPADQQAES